VLKLSNIGYLTSKFVVFNIRCGNFTDYFLIALVSAVLLGVLVFGNFVVLRIRAEEERLKPQLLG